MEKIPIEELKITQQEREEKSAFDDYEEESKVGQDGVIFGEPSGDELLNAEKLSTILENAEGITTWKALGLKNIPHIGIYSFNYEWMPIISYFKGMGNEDWKEIVPTVARNAVSKLLSDQKLEVGKVEYLCV